MFRDRKVHIKFMSKCFHVKLVCVLEPNVGVHELVHIGENLLGFELSRELFAGYAQAIIAQYPITRFVERFTPTRVLSSKPSSDVQTLQSTVNVCDLARRSTNNRGTSLAQGGLSRRQAPAMTPGRDHVTQEHEVSWPLHAPFSLVGRVEIY